MTTLQKPIVALENSTGHYEGTIKSLKHVEDEIAKKLKGKTKVLVKPNFVSTRKELAATKVGSVKAILEVIRKYYDGEITIGEGPASGSLEDGIRNYGYRPLVEDYKLRLVDLNQDKSVELDGYDSNLNPIKYNASKTIHDCDFLVSAALAKTHDTVVATLSIKNIVVGSLVTTKEKEKIHQGYKAINLNIAKIIQRRPPDLAVVDGFVGMEGQGPEDGDPVPLRAAAASLHPVSLDAVMAKVMGFEPLDIGYLNHLDSWGIGVARLSEINVVGQRISDVARKFKPHSTYQEQLNWR